MLHYMALFFLSCFLLSRIMALFFLFSCAGSETACFIAPYSARIASVDALFIMHYQPDDNRLSGTWFTCTYGKSMVGIWFMSASCLYFFKSFIQVLIKPFIFSAALLLNPGVASAAPGVDTPVSEATLDGLSDERQDIREQQALAEQIREEQQALAEEIRVRLVMDALGKLYRFLPSSTRERWAAVEHQKVGDSIMLHFANGEKNSTGDTLELPNGLSLSVGQIIALAGDFYGVPGTPVTLGYQPQAQNTTAEQEALFKQQFLAAYQTLAYAPEAPEEFNKTKVLIEKERATIDRYLRQGLTAKAAYDELGNSLSEAWDKIYGGSSWLGGKIPIPGLMGRYLKLAEDNQDHFAPYSYKAYQVGHGLAIEKALEASRADTAEQRDRLLVEAYAMDAFAGHFLTDSFAAGHMRVPRIKLPEVTFLPVIGSLLTKYMHDEDNENGLWVTNGLGDKWQAFGDGSLFDSVNDANTDKVIAAVQVSFDEVYQAFVSSEAVESTMAAYFPRVDDQAANSTPMFQYDKVRKVMLRRERLDDIYSTAMVENSLMGWWSLSTLLLTL